ncbi:RNA-binding transcriptional accessory protein [Cryomorpha ignava]|uniref:RNA-binding transcriptional accessory protein n=1 Tax=Cryomorpha ignava TaxID=101383 RepID=A0A7K3WXD4_9FLAO|nr:Tex family protein [Cryomorpha ignava]NEN25295.1 RNA-binding transcriptional accessory protein [Cryomorpha ignava]
MAETTNLVIERSRNARISKNLNISEKQVASTLALFAEGATIPFIARYRQERTGGLDEVEIAAIQKENAILLELEKRRAFILESISDQGLMTDELKKQIVNSWSLTELEDLYLPFKPKRKTKASVARENGLEPLAGAIMKQESGNVEQLAKRFVKGNISNVDEALEGARHIMSEWVSERQRARETVRRLFRRKAAITAKLVKGKETEAEKYRDYFEFSEPLQRIPSHRLLAIRRAESEGFLRVAISPPEEEALKDLDRIFVKSGNQTGQQVELAVKDAYKRLLKPSIETEFKSESKEKADEQAISVFAENLRQLLLTPPVGQKRTLAIDPGFKSGCKTVCLDAQGQLLHNETIYPHPPQRETSQAAAKVGQLVESYKLEAVAIGNGTAGRETEDFIRQRVRFRDNVEVYMVNEAGASVYSASSVARKEFPDYDVTVRGAVSIGRRLLDPLAELVKIDPKSIGVGQYQHDVDQNKLKESLDQTVISVVNQVGVELNTASVHLLSYVSGLGPKLAENIVEYRNENGVFESREALKKVKGLGPKAFEQSAGFLRISDAKNPLDNSAVHPESYGVVRKMAKDLKKSIDDLVGARSAFEAIDLNRYVTGETGLPTLKNIVESLGKIGRDPRGKAKMFSFDPSLRKVEDLKEGMIVPGIVTNIAGFGAFVDVGVKQDGLIHVSEMADRFVSDPNEIVKLNQQVQVKVVSVDVARKRIQLSLKM